MKLAQSLIPSLRRIRDIPGNLGLRPYRVFVVNTALGGKYGLEGSESTTWFELKNYNQPPKVRQLNQEQLALGMLEQGSLTVGPITTFLESTDLNDAEIHTQLRFRVEFHGYKDECQTAYFRLHSLKRDRAMHYILVLRPEGNV